MQIPRENIIIGLIALTVVFLLAGGFLILYVALYNERKRKHQLEKDRMKIMFDEELLKTQLEVQEQTLKTIAADIHDNVGQVLSLTKLTLGSINVESQPQKVSQKVNDAFQMVDQSIKDLRQLVHILHADNFLSDGLEHALGKELIWLSKIEGLEIRSSTIGTSLKKLSGDKELIAFRLVQEVLNNIVRHAEATLIQVSFHYFPDKMKIQVSDNGKGFSVEQKRLGKTGLGIGNFYKRAKMIDGDFQLHSVIGEGTTATLIIPFSAYEGR